MPGETDKTRWRGVQPVLGIRGIWPARDSVRVNIWGNLLGTAVLDIYTVPSGKILFLFSAFLASRLSSAQACRSTLFVKDHEDADQYPIIYQLYDVAGHQLNTQQFSPAIELAAGWDVYLYNSSALLDCRGAIHGWLEDA